MLTSYALTVEEEALATRIGYERQAPMLGQPERNRNYSEGDAWEAYQHIVCVGSEIAFARMLGDTTFVPHVNKFKSELDLPEWGEVRFGFPRGWPNRRGTLNGLRMTVNDDDHLKYALLAEGLSNRTRREAPDWLGAPYVAIGWLWGWEAKRDEWRYNQTSWYAPISALHRFAL